MARLGGGPAGVAFSGAVLPLALALTVVLRAGADAPPAARPSPEAELEAQLASAVAKAPPAEVVVVVVGPDPKLYRLEEASLRLDGAPFSPSGALDAGPAQGTVVSDGDHVVSARLVYRGQALGPYPWEEGLKWTLPARVSVQASRGLRFIIRLTVEANERAPAGLRLSLRSEVEPAMLVAVDDAPLPPPPQPKLPPPAPAVVPPPAQVAAAPTPPTPAASKKTTKKKARVTRPAAAVSTTATVSTAAPGSPDALEEATARLKSALAAPRDGGASEAPR